MLNGCAIVAEMVSVLFGMLTVLPDLIAIWRIQAQMVSDIAGLYGKEVALTRAHMVYCLFRHATTQVARDVVVRADPGPQLDWLVAVDIEEALQVSADLRT